MILTAARRLSISVVFDLNAYAQAEEAACRVPAPAAEAGLPVLGAGGCCGAPAPQQIHEQLADLLSRYDVNALAASVKIFAVKPGANQCL